MKVKVYHLKEVIEVPDGSRKLYGKRFDYIPYPGTSPSVFPNIEDISFDIKKVGIFLEKDYIPYYFVIEDNNEKDSLSYILHNTESTNHNLLQKAKKLKELENLTLFQRIFQWKKYTNT